MATMRVSNRLGTLRLAEAPAALPATLAAEACTPPAAAPPAGLDDRLAAYIAAAQGPFDNLRQAASQTAALMVLAVSGARSATPDHPMLALAEALHEEALDALGAMRVPDAARHHAYHLRAAARRIGGALAAARSQLHGGDAGAMDAVLAPLNAGWTELRHAGAALPGFEVIGFSQSCCAAHAWMRPQAPETRPRRPA